jgi:hypothetical protein
MNHQRPTTDSSPGVRRARPPRLPKRPTQSSFPFAVELPGGAVARYQERAPDPRYTIDGVAISLDVWIPHDFLERGWSWGNASTLVWVDAQRRIALATRDYGLPGVYDAARHCTPGGA